MVDDGSQDGTVSAVEAAADGDRRLRLLRRPPGGIVAALTAGLSALGPGCELVGRMDGDDLMHPDRLGEQVAALDGDPTLAAVGTRVHLHPADSGLRGYVDWLNTHELPSDIARDIFVEAPLCHPSVTMRRSALLEAGGYRDPPWPEDYDLWLRMHALGLRMGVVARTLHVWRDSAGRLTRTDPRYGADRFFRAKAHYLARLLGAEVRIWGAGRDGKRLARALEAEGVRIVAFLDIDPRKIGGVRRGGVPVLGPDALGPPGRTPVVTAVGVRGARAKLRAMFEANGYVDGRDFVCAA